MKKLTSRKIAFYGVLSALMFVFLLTETYLLRGVFGDLTPAILTLPFAVALSLFKDKKGIWIGGTIFGCCSFFLAVCIGNVVFLNPLVSILPRVFIGIVAYVVYWLASKIFASSKSNFLKETLPVSLGGAFGILTNSVCTITMMWLFNSADIAVVLTTIISVNFLAEVVGACVLVPVYKNVLKRVENIL